VNRLTPSIGEIVYAEVEDISGTIDNPLIEFSVNLYLE